VAGSSGTGNLRINASSLYVAAKSTVELNDSFSLYSKLGLAHNHVDSTGSGALETITPPGANKGSLYFGFGAQYKLSQNVDVTLGLDHFGISDSVGNGSTVVSTGLRYGF
jgi:OOP family OmpA-OmpF porin